MNRPLTTFSKMLIACSAFAIGVVANAATEDDTDKLMMSCTFKHRDTSENSTRRVTVSRGSSNALGLRTQLSGNQSSQRFTLAWRNYDATHGNRWYIMPGDRESCIGYSVTDIYPLSAQTSGCTDDDYFYIKKHDSYYIISKSTNFGRSWRIASGAADTEGTTVFVGKYDVSEPLGTRRSYHWTIRDCFNQSGTPVNPPNN